MSTTLRRPAEAEPESGVDPDRRAREEQSHRWYVLAVAGAILLGVLIRAYHVLHQDFPVNDGGMFYAMVQDLQRSHFRLPDFTSYNGLRIPYAYSPFGFYVVAVLTAFTPLSLFGAFRFVPLVVTCLTIPAFWLLARSVLPSRTAVAAATFAFALIPRSFIWLLMGGGLTRSFGMLFTILALHQMYLLYTRRDYRFVLPAALFTGLTVLSHLGTVPFLVVSIVLFFVAYGRHKQGVIGSVAVAIGALVITAPWWATILTHHGVGPFLAAQATGGSVLSGGEARWEVRQTIAHLGLGLTGEPLFPLLLVLALLGSLASLSAGRLLLPGWWLAILLIEIRAPGTYVSLPVALLAGIGVVDVVLPALRRRSARGVGTVRTDRSQPDGAGARGGVIPGQMRFWPTLVFGGFVVYCSLAALIHDLAYPGGLGFLQSLKPAERAAMHWASDNTPPSSRFLVVTAAGWPHDRSSEWFPVLAQRQSIATVQGYEWLPNHAFARQQTIYEQAQGCARRDASCLTKWSATYHRPFTHVYVPSSEVGADATDGCCKNLVASLRGDTTYSLVYSGPGAVIFAKR